MEGKFIRADTRRERERDFLWNVTRDVLPRLKLEGSKVQYFISAIFAVQSGAQVGGVGWSEIVTDPLGATEFWRGVEQRQGPRCCSFVVLRDV